MLFRLKAFGLHLLASMCVISVFLAFVFLIWYPEPYYKIYGVWGAIKIVVGVDLIIGPLLVLIVFNESKKASELGRDLFIIVFFQLSAFIWGVHITHAVRPSFSVFHEGTFYLFSKQDVDVARMDNKKLVPAFWQPATKVYVKPPKDKEEYNHIYAHLIDADKRPDVMYLTERYLPLIEIEKKVIDSALNIKSALKQPEKENLINAFLMGKEKELSECLFYSVKGANTHVTMVVDKLSGETIGYIEANLEY
ncbi:MAG: hypothetical protein OQK98_01425 [Gammaproteobacteria bacterium]|nr:hypothetical protein [Gammaproteobacteria bacterium]